MNPVLALALLAIAGVLVTRLPRFPAPRSRTLDLVRAGGAPLVLLGVVLGPGIAVLDRPTLAALAPVSALAVGWVGARLGARCEWRLLRRVRRESWALITAQAVAGVGVGFVAAWLGTRLVPALAAAWTPHLPAALTLGAVAILPGARPMERAARAAGLAPRQTRSLRRVALLDAACGTLACAIAVGLGHPQRSSLVPGWAAWLAVEVGAATIVATVFLGLSLVTRDRDELGLGLLGVLLLGAGLGYAADLSPFVVCALAAALIVNLSPQRRHVRTLLAAWERPTYEILLVLVGAALTLPTLWLLAAAPVLAALRVMAQWSTVRSGLAYVPTAALPPSAGLANAAQGGSALALGLSFWLAHGVGGGGGAVLTTIVLGVLLTHLAAPSLMRLALGAPQLTPARLTTELSPGSSPD